MTELAQKMIEFRGAHNMSQQDLADLAKVDRVTVLRAEKGIRVSNLTAAKILYAIKTKG